jgi:hypothetical protein
MPLPSTRPASPINRKFHAPAIGEFDVSRADIEPAAAVAAFDDITGPDGKSAGQAICARMHETPPGTGRSARDQAKAPGKRSVLASTNLKSLWNTVETRLMSAVCFKPQSRFLAPML